jgi:hypothetical protein
VEFVSQVTACDSGATAAESVSTSIICFLDNFINLFLLQMKSLSGHAGRLKLNKLPRLLESGTEEDDWLEAVEKVTSAAEIL